MKDPLIQRPTTYWWVSGLGENDADGNDSLDLVRPPARFEYVEDLGEYEEEHVLQRVERKSLSRITNTGVFAPSTSDALDQI